MSGLNNNWQVSAGQVAGAAAGAGLAGPAGIGVGSALGGALGGIIGPSYTPGGGGEIRRGLAADNWPSWRLETYIKWLSVHHPDIYDGVEGRSMYDLPGIGHPGQWNGALSQRILETDDQGNRLREEGGPWTLDLHGNVVDIASGTQQGTPKGGGKTYDPNKPLSMDNLPKWVVLVAAASLLVGLGYWVYRMTKRRRTRRKTRKLRTL